MLLFIYFFTLLMGQTFISQLSSSNGRITTSLRHQGTAAFPRGRSWAHCCGCGGNVARVDELDPARRVTLSRRYLVRCHGNEGDMGHGRVSASCLKIMLGCPGSSR